MGFADLDEVQRTEALQKLITETIAALGDEKAKPFEIEAYFECVEMPDDQFSEVWPRVKVVKK